MPLALVLIPVGVVVLLVVGGVLVAQQNYQWSLSAPSGNTTWDNIVRWVDSNIRAVVDWAFKGIKSGVTEIVKGLGLTYDSLAVLVDFVKALPAKSKGVAEILIAAAIFSNVTPVKKMAENLQANINTVIKADISSLKTSVATLIRAVTVTLPARILLAETAIQSIKVWISGEYIRTISNLNTRIADIIKSISTAISRIAALEALVSGKITRIITVELPAQIAGVVKRVAGLETLISTTLMPMFNQFNEWKKWLKELIDALKEIVEETADDVLESDAAGLVGQYGWIAAEITKVYAQTAPELLKALKEGYDVG